MIFFKPKSPTSTPPITPSEITVNGCGLSSGTVGEQSTFSIFAPSKSISFDPSSCSVAFEGPSKPEIRFVATKSQVDCQWCPLLPGNYKVYVRYQGEEIPGSPFTCQVDGSISLGRSHLQHIRCSGAGLSGGRIKKDNHILIDRVAGVIGGLSVSMEGPSQPKISFTKNPDDTLSLIYRVSEPGEYTLNVTFTDIHVSGSPFKLNVT